LYVDLHLVTFLDSSGIGALVTARKRAERVGARLILEHPTPVAYRTLETAGLVDFLGLSRP
jgi:anti-anti-sigma factor